MRESTCAGGRSGDSDGPLVDGTGIGDIYLCCGRYGPMVPIAALRRRNGMNVLEARGNRVGRIARKARDGKHLGAKDGGGTVVFTEMREGELSSARDVSTVADGFQVAHMRMLTPWRSRCEPWPRKASRI